MKFGTKVIKRDSARNYHHKESQQRLDEIVPSFNRQVLNALNVDAVPVFYYSALRVGKACSCEKEDIENVETSPVESGSRAFVIGQSSSSTFGEDIIEYVDDEINMFGDEQINDSVIVDESDEFSPVEDVEEYTGEDSPFAGHNINCGICYRTGFVPGYFLLQGTRVTLTHHDIVDAVGYTVDRQSFPYCIKKLDPDGYVAFAVNIPKYYQRVKFTIRNNTDITKDYLFMDKEILSRKHIDAKRGKQFVFYVRARAFTHVVLEFSSDTTAINSNIQNISKTLDYNRLETIGNIQVILPMTIGNVVSGDLLAAPTRNLFLKVVDVTHQQTAKMKKLEWQTSCRVLQPQEALRKMAFGYVIN